VNLEEHLGASAVELHAAQLVDEEEVDSAVAGDGAVQLHLIGGFHQFVDQTGREGVFHPVALLSRRSAQPDEKVRLAGARVSDQATARLF
jgi:hypothetical protein